MPSPYSTIVAALASSGDGDTVLVAPGGYREHIVMPTGSRTLASYFLIAGDTAFVDSTVLRPDTLAAADSQSVVSVLDSTASLHLIGFTVSDGRGTDYYGNGGRCGGALLQSQGIVRIDYCRFRANEADLGSAILSDSGSASLRLDHCDIGYNHTFGQGTAAAAAHQMEFRNTRFHHNEGSWARAVDATLGTIAFVGCVVDSNQGGHTGTAAVHFVNCENIDVRSSIFRDNMSDTVTSSGAVVMWIESPRASLINSDFINNTGASAAGLVVAECTLLVTGCTFRSNRSTLWGATINIVQRCIATFTDCRIEDNSAAQWPGITSTSPLALTACRFNGNIADRPDVGGALLIADAPAARLTARDCIFDRNSPYAVNECNQGNHVIDARQCYWGDSSGPYQVNLNPGGQGDAICGDQVQFVPWLTEPPAETNPPRGPIPSNISLLSVYPNPFNSEARIEYDVKKAGRVELKVFDLTGRLVRTLSDEVQAAGRHEIGFDGSGLASGTYFVKLQAGNIRRTEKMMLLK